MNPSSIEPAPKDIHCNYMIGCSSRWMNTMKAKIVRIGNSQGVRIPKALLEQAGLSADVSFQVTEEGLLISPAPHVRRGWAEAASALQERSSSSPDPFLSTDFDEQEWEW